MFRISIRNKDSNVLKIKQAVKKSHATWFGRVRNILKGGMNDDLMWEELEEILISSDVGVNTSIEILEDLRQKIKLQQVTDPDKILELLKTLMITIMDTGSDIQYSGDWGKSDLIPHVILVVGVNGVGKTTTVGKLAHYYKQMGNRVMLAAGDTFRAGAIDQLQIWGERVGVDVIAQSYGADPGAVAFDAFKAAKARNSDVLIVDTAGRLHNKTNLMEEVKKIRQVMTGLDSRAPHEILLVLDATTGYNGLAQAKTFSSFVGCNRIFLSKLDGTAKGGVVLAIKKELELPIHYIGTGEQVQDMALFSAEQLVEAMFASSY
ncbi:signal recognition particle-docking protein FtsY [SAR202 cluster bacterium AC-409-J13_OGT_754m]|nr:signal recognition particle-docking protein FtsY [SAR202 cluster bacterium AC-409-J13_OGT_754m]